MVAPAVDGIDLFKIAGRSISGWISSLKTGSASHVRQPFCSQLEERLLLWLEYNPQVVSYARGDIGPPFAATYRLPIPKHAPFAIGYTFEGKPHDYLPDVVGTLSNGKAFIAEAGMEDDKRQDRNLAKAEAARRLARLQRGTYWLGTERTLTRQRHYNLVFLHARRQSFSAFADIALAVQEVWPWGEVASVEEVESRLAGRWPAPMVEAAIWKIVADAAALGHLLVDLEWLTLDRTLPLALLPPDAASLVPDPLPDTLEPVPKPEVVMPSPDLGAPVPGPTFDASTLDEKQREQFHRNLRAVEQVLAGAHQTTVAAESGIPRSTLGRLVRRTREKGQIACVPRGSYTRKTTMHPAFQECIRRLYLLPTRLSMTAIHEHTDMRQVVTLLSNDTGITVKLPSYDQVRREVHRLEKEPDLVAVREGAKSLPRARESPESFALSIPAPALLTQVDEHSLELYVVTPDGIAITKRVIDGVGPSIEAPQSESAAEARVNGTEAERVSSPSDQPENPTLAPTSRTEMVDQTPSARSEHATSRDVVGDPKQSAKPTKCTFSGVIPIEAKRFLESGVRLVECPDCASSRTLSLHKGVLRFQSHDKRKTRTPKAAQRWVMGKTDWEVVGGREKMKSSVHE